MNTQIQQIDQDERPPIVVAEEDFDALSDVAERLRTVMPEVADFLDEELTRADILPLKRVPSDVVTMNSEVEFLMGPRGRVDRLRLVYPGDHTVDAGCVSIASPVGVALLGLKPGQTISWSSRHGDLRSVKVLKLISRQAPEA
ncbi:MAG: nucleoside diphosphate kinase regulator [Parvibaculum sp.]|uniref:nucleoside diphosphate kinase regulator n=1 Tax=Parvibaculum sp. TaxID=2024848 RepID=UPI002B5211FD|nr:nucleoside diphosphate kinase regulator [Parvibaculum sp.]HMM14775.1 nucleoside diphosphate kinase regulator [Parvibaculum sp.]